MTDTLAIARRLLAGALVDGGATVSTDGSPLPTVGFMVGGAVPEWAAPADILTVNRVRQFVDLYSTRKYLGSWSDHGRIVFDVSTHHDSYADALRVARERGERAVWDIVNAQSILV